METTRQLLTLSFVDAKVLAYGFNYAAIRSAAELANQAKVSFWDCGDHGSGSDGLRSALYRGCE